MLQDDDDQRDVFERREVHRHLPRDVHQADVEAVDRHVGGGYQEGGGSGMAKAKGRCRCGREVVDMRMLLVGVGEQTSSSCVCHSFQIRCRVACVWCVQP